MKHRDMTKGNVAKILIIIAMPVILSNLMNMAYNFIDMYWVGKINEQALGALGTAGLFIWLSNGVIMLSRIGLEVLLAQALGEKKLDKAKRVATNGIKYGIIIALLFSLFIIFNRSWLIDIFNLLPAESEMAKVYLVYGGASIFFMMMNQVYMSLFQSLGKTMYIFIFMVIGLVTNMILDPFFIFGLELGIEGAALATLIGSAIPAILFTLFVLLKTDYYKNFNLNLDLKIIKKMSNLSYMVAFQNVVYTLIGMYISVLVVQVDQTAFAAQRVGNNIESLTWMIGLGVASSIGAFTAQNYGAKNYTRILTGLKLTLIAMSIYGFFISLLFIFKGQVLFLMFTTDQNALLIGGQYLMILGFSQIGVIFEGVASGVFNALGHTKIPVFWSLSGNLLRVIVCVLLSRSFGLNGIWIGLTVTNMYKGLGILLTLFIYFLKTPEYKEEFLNIMKIKKLGK